MEFEEEVLLFMLLHKQVKKKKRKHKFWIHLLLNSRQEQRIFYTVINDVRNDKSKFFNNFYVSWLLEQTSPVYQKWFLDQTHEIYSSIKVADCKLAVSSNYSNCFYTFASSCTVFMPSSKCITDTVIDDLLNVSCFF
jgi:hypothetical protein